MTRKELIVFSAFVAVVLAILALFATKTVEIQIELPPAEAPKAAPVTPIYIDVADDGRITIEGSPSSLDTLTADLTARSHATSKDDQRIMIRASKDIPYDRFMAVLNSLQDHGWRKIGLVNEDIPAPKP